VRRGRVPVQAARRAWIMTVTVMVMVTVTVML
jgi:hypothetical protein